MMRFVLPAIALSLGLHAALLAWSAGPDAVEYGAERAVSSTVIVFDASPATVASASAGAEETAAQQPVEAEDRPAEALPDQELAEAPAAEAPAAEAVDDAQAEHAALQPDPEPTSEPVAEPAPPQPAETTAFVPIPRLKPPVPTRLVQEQPSSENSVRRKPPSNPDPKTRSRKASADKGNRRKARQRPVRKATSRRTGKATAKRRSGSAGRSGGASAGEKAAYARRVLSHIQRYKRFPPGASAGKVRLKVRISAGGTLQAASVRRSSGHRVLDKAALATARRASPYPKPPGGRSFSFTVSLRYKR